MIKLLSFILSLFLMPLITACTDKPGQVEFNEQLAVYKSPSCGCCQEWIDHLEERGFDTQVEHPEKLEDVKNRFNVPLNARSCHTAVSKQGYVFEGHIPARYVQQFLADPPDGAIGLAVPAMPLGSPGMEVDDRFTPYQILLLKQDGNTEVFADIQNSAEQYDEKAQP